MSNTRKESNTILNEVKKELTCNEKTGDIINESSSHDDMADTIKILEIVEEATSAGMQMRSYEGKKNAAVAAIAVSMAKKNNDPLYERLKHFRGAWKHSKDDILQRYSAQAVQKWQAGQNR